MSKILMIRATSDCCGSDKGGSGAKLCNPKTSSGNQVLYKPYVKPVYLGHDLTNMRLNRPMSPHLMIYAPTLPAMTSIAQRITGTILTFYALLLGVGALFLSNGIDTYVSAIQSLDLSRFSILIIKLVLGAPFGFHYLNGIRFVAFNAGRWLMMKEVYSTAYKAMAGTAIIAVVFALL